ncbi:TRAP transporter substrate-binding protein [Paracoccus methylarcula]|uniref:C4-dicarboxylate ABC transporter substrate-binding protein n=1 Tax=Paracoccus methylarcula TaxID=72022 RepID=A0A3R7NBR9_9RHOB|nr:TRAP transporter substrate-binding protein [Paracoccus methylarcula]RNF34345.1 C4-dicarboxylate ABC transporter substrate-binding protein [Paracoccus methylarcula]
MNKTVAALIGMAFSLATLGTASAETIRIAGNFAGEHSSSQAMLVFKEEIEKLTDGELEVNIFPAQQLGGAAENVQAVKLGAVELIWVGTAYLTRTIPELEVLGVPFQFPDRETAFKVVDGPLGAKLDEHLAEESLASLGYMELGFRQLTNNVRPIESIDDIAGLKIRLQPNETHLATFRALGANPVAMDVKELYSALEQGVIDGQENPFSIIVVSRYSEIQKHLSDTRHFFDFISVVANKDWLDELSPEHRDAVQEAMNKAIAFQRELAIEQESEALDKLIEEGMTFTPVSDELAADLRSKTADVATSVRERIGDELFTLVDSEIAASTE